MCYIVDAAHTVVMYEFIPLVAIVVVALVSTVLVTGRDGYRRIPRKH
ncbi:hypothetical protein BH09ACT4_BH09ACT4_23530 [soil metagenome]